jgi:hypothetical protein
MPSVVDLADARLGWSDLFNAIQVTRRRHSIPPETFVVLLTSRPNTENWFSACAPDGERSAFVHTSDWEYLVACDTAHAIAYQVIENVLQVFMFGSLDECVSASHDPPIGCLSDMCVWKPDITLKMRTADICPDCLEICVRRKIPADLLDQALAVMDKVRAGALFTSGRREDPPTGASLPFPVAFTKRKLSMTTEPLRKFLLLIDHFDSLMRTSTLMLGRILLGNEFQAFADKQELTGNPSLGHWVAALQALGNVEANQQEVGMSLPPDFHERLDLVVRRATDDRIVQLRNEKRGHGYLDCHNHTYREVFESCLPAVQFAESVLRPLLTGLTLVFVETSRHVGRDEAEICLRTLMGDHPDFLEERIRQRLRNLEDMPIELRVYAVPQGKGHWHDLHDSIVYDHCPVCQHSRVLLADGSRYLDPYVGHRVSLDTH